MFHKNKIVFAITVLLLLVFFIQFFNGRTYAREVLNCYSDCGYNPPDDPDDPADPSEQITGKGQNLNDDCTVGGGCSEVINEIATELGIPEGTEVIISDDMEEWLENNPGESPPDDWLDGAYGGGGYGSLDIDPPNDDDGHGDIGPDYDPTILSCNNGPNLTCLETAAGPPSKIVDDKIPGVFFKGLQKSDLWNTYPEQNFTFNPIAVFQYLIEGVEEAQHYDLISIENRFLDFPDNKPYGTGVSHSGTCMDDHRNYGYIYIPQDGWYNFATKANFSADPENRSCYYCPNDTDIRYIGNCPYNIDDSNHLTYICPDGSLYGDVPACNGDGKNDVVYSHTEYDDRSDEWTTTNYNCEELLRSEYKWNFENLGCRVDCDGTISSYIGLDKKTDGNLPAGSSEDPYQPPNYNIPLTIDDQSVPPENLDLEKRFTYYAQQNMFKQFVDTYNGPLVDDKNVTYDEDDTERYNYTYTWSGPLDRRDDANTKMKDNVLPYLYRTASGTVDSESWVVQGGNIGSVATVNINLGSSKNIGSLAFYTDDLNGYEIRDCRWVGSGDDRDEYCENIWIPPISYPNHIMIQCDSQTVINQDLNLSSALPASWSWWHGYVLTEPLNRSCSNLTVSFTNGGQTHLGELQIHSPIPQPNYVDYKTSGPKYYLKGYYPVQMNANWFSDKHVLNDPKLYWQAYTSQINPAPNSYLVEYPNSSISIPGGETDPQYAGELAACSPGTVTPPSGPRADVRVKLVSSTSNICSQIKSAGDNGIYPDGDYAADLKIGISSVQTPPPSLNDGWFTWENLSLSDPVTENPITYSVDITDEPENYVYRNICVYVENDQQPIIANNINLSDVFEDCDEPSQECGVVDVYLGYKTPPGPWFQTKGGDVYAYSTITSLLPENDPPIYFNMPGLGGYPGLVIHGSSGSYDFSLLSDNDGKNQVSKDSASSGINWLANDLYTPFTPYYYDRFFRMIRSTITEITDLFFSSLPADSGVYHVPSSVTEFLIANNLSVPSDKKYIYFIEGNLIIDENINIHVENGGFLAFIVKGGITVSEDVGYNSPQSIGTDSLRGNLEGIYIADGVGLTDSQNAFQILSDDNENTPDKQFVGKGTFVAKNFGLDRNLINENLDFPAIAFIFDPNLIVYMPEDMLRVPFKWQEVPPRGGQ